MTGNIIISLLVPLMFIGGALVGDMLRPGQGTVEAHGGDGAHAGSGPAHGAPGHGENGATVDRDCFRFPTQFMVPVFRNGHTRHVMVLSLTVETSLESLEYIHKQEHRLRDALLRRLLIHANTGGFDGNFTSEPHLRRLRAALLKAARDASGAAVTGILIEDIARQEQ